MALDRPSPNEIDRIGADTAKAAGVGFETRSPEIARIQTIDFLKVIWPSQGHYCIAQRKRNGDRTWWQHDSFDTIEAAAEMALAVGQNTDTYFTVLSLRKPFVINQAKIDKAIAEGRKITERTGRSHRSQSNIAWARCFFLDIDIGKTDGYPTKEIASQALIAFVKSAQLPAPWAVQSGVGIHVYWPLAEDVSVQEWRLVASNLKALCQHLGLKADPSRTADPTSVLRVPGTVHLKDLLDPKPVEVVRVDRVTPFEVFRAAIEKAAALTPVGNTWSLLSEPRKPIPLSEMEETLRFLSDRGFFSKRKGIEKDAAGRIVKVGWIDTGMALKLAYGEQGQELWELTHEDDRARADAPAQWVSFSAEPAPGQVTIATIVKAARDARVSASPDVGDVKNGRLFAELYRDQMLHVHETDEWLLFDAKRGWLSAPPGEADRAAKAVLAKLRHEAAERYKNAPDDGKRLLDHANKTSFAPRLRAMIDMAKSEPGMTVALNEFDAEPMRLGVMNGVLDLTIGRLLDVSPGVLVSKRCSVGFDRGAACPRFEQFMVEVQPDPCVRGFIQRWIGYCLTGRVDEQAFVFLHGHGANGKSVLIELVAWLLGDYAQKISTAMLMQHQRNPQGPSPDIVALKGRRFVYANETEEGRRLAEALVKDLTGGDTLTGRVPYGKAAISFGPTHKLAIAGNHKPDILDGSHGMWRRVLLVAFDETIPGHARDPRLPEKLRAEGSGVLNWALEGLRAYSSQGLRAPPKIKAATEAYRNEQDVLNDYLTECCDVDDDREADRTQLYLDYSAWCQRHGHRPLSQNKLTRRLIDRAFRLDGGRRKVLGLALKKSLQRT